MIDEEEEFSTLARSQFVLRELMDAILSGWREVLDELPNGIHKGFVKLDNPGLFFYTQDRRK